MLSLLVRASLEGALLAAGVWILCRVLPRLSPAVRALLWWCVAAKFAVSLVWHAPIELAVLPAGRGAPVRETHDMSAAPTTVPREAGMAATQVARESAPPSLEHVPTVSLTAALLALWALGIGVSLVRVLGAWRETRAVVLRSTPGHDALHAIVRDLSARLGLRRAPDVRVSHEIESPLITGVRRSVILVPADRFTQLTTEQQRMALCHELAHMKRGDVWLGFVPALVERCFFFHPLARLAAREYAFWREAACDEAVITTLGASPQSYGRLLLALGVARQPATFAAAGAAWSFSNLKRRIIMLGHSSAPSPGGRVLAAGAVAFTMLAVAPVKAVARPADSPAAAAVAAAVPTAVPAAVPAAVAPVRVFAPVTGDMNEAPVPAPMQGRQTREERERERRAQEERARIEEDRARLQEERTRLQEERARVLEERARIERGERTRERDSRESRTTAERVRDRAQERRSDPDENFVYIVGDEQTMMSGERGDLARARRFRRGTEPLLWFRRDGQEYIVRDRAVLRDVADLWDPVSRIGSQQGEIGTKQGAIGQEQGRYGAKQGEIGARQGIIGARQGVVAAQLGLLAARESQGLSAAERREIARERATLERDMRALDREMEAMGRQMREASPPRRDLSDAMSALDRQMSVLGEQMNTASRRANSGMRALIDRAIRSGTAEAVR